MDNLTSIIYKNYTFTSHIHFMILMSHFISFRIAYPLTNYYSWYFNIFSCKFYTRVKSDLHHHYSIRIFIIWPYTYLYQWILYFHMFLCCYLASFSFQLEDLPLKFFIRQVYWWWTCSAFVFPGNALLLS